MSVQQNSRVADWIRINASTVPNRACFVTDTASFTFREVNSRVNRIASALRRMGVSQGDRVALFATDSAQYVETLLACMKLGALYVPLNFRLARPELQALLRTAEAKVLFYSDRYTGLVRGVDVPGLKTVISYDSESGDESYEGLVAASPDEEIDVPVADSDIVCLAFTSGTTALPKGVLHSQRMAKHMVMQCIVERRMTNLSFHYSAAPLFHVGGMLYTLSGVARGHTSLVLPAFDAPTVAHWMARGGLDGVFLVPTMIDTLLHEYGRGPGGLLEPQVHRVRRRADVPGAAAAGDEPVLVRLHEHVRRGHGGRVADRAHAGGPPPRAGRAGAPARLDRQGGHGRVAAAVRPRRRHGAQ